MSNFIELIKNKDLEGIRNTTITSGDINEFRKYYQEVEDLIFKYEETITGRKEYAREIREKLVLINSFLGFFKNRIERMDTFYEFAEHYIPDHYRALRILLKLLNDKEDKYVLKSYEVTCSGVERTFENVWVIFDKKMIGTLKSCSAEEFKECIIKMINAGESLIFICEDSVKNKVMAYKGLNVRKEIVFRTNGLYSDINCYINDEKFEIAVNNFNSYIQKNGADISYMDEDLLIDAITHPKETQTRVLKLGD